MLLTPLVLSFENRSTIGRVVVAGCVSKERKHTVRRVVAAGCVAEERLSTVGRVAGADCKAKERIITLGRVGAGVASVRRWNDRSRSWRKWEAGKQKRDEN